eukprot:SAG11_NODE_32286_length_284_cov_48.037838_1_plen_52_part_01
MWRNVTRHLSSYIYLYFYLCILQLGTYAISLYMCFSLTRVLVTCISCLRVCE